MVLVGIYSSSELQEHPVLNNIPFTVWKDVYNHKINLEELLLVEMNIKDSLNAIVNSSKKELQLQQLLLIYFCNKEATRETFTNCLKKSDIDQSILIHLACIQWSFGYHQSSV